MMHLTLPALLLLACVLLAAGASLWIGLCVATAWSILTPPRMTAGKAIYHLRRLSPGDLGLSFEERLFTVEDTRTKKRLRLASWWIPASPAAHRTIVLIHGYADAKVGAIAFAPLLNGFDLNILAIDLRAHGESGGRFSAGGFFERHDVSQIIDQLRAEQPNQTNQVILFGISLGATVAAATAAIRDDIAGVILESPFPSYHRVITNHAKLMNMPAGRILHRAIALAERFSGANFSEVRLVDQLPKLRCPLLVIVGNEDVLLREIDLEAIRTSTTSAQQGEFWPVEDADHLQAMAINPTEFHRRIGAFLDHGNVGR